MPLPPTLQVNAPTYMGAVTVPKQGSRVIRMATSPFNFHTTPSTAIPLFYGSGTYPSTGCFYGLYGYYTTFAAWAPATYGSIQMALVRAFNMSGFGIFDITTNAIHGSLSGNTQSSGTSAASAIGRNGLYAGSTGFGANNLQSEQTIAFPKEIFVNTTLPFSAVQTRPGTPGPATASNTGSFPMPIIDQFGVEHFVFYCPTQQQIGANIYHSSDLACDFGGGYGASGLVMASPVFINKNGISNGIWLTLAGLQGFAVNPITDRWISYGNTGAPNANLVYSSTVLCPVNPLSQGISFPGYFSITLSDPTDQANLVTSLAFGTVQTTVLPGGSFGIFSGSSNQLFILNENLLNYTTVNGLVQSGGNKTQWGVDITGNIWAIGNNNGIYTGVTTSLTIPQQPLWINPPLLNSFGLSCRVGNDCTASFEG